jgi:hypothetical protein
MHRDEEAPSTKYTRGGYRNRHKHRILYKKQQRQFNKSELNGIVSEAMEHQVVCTHCDHQFAVNKLGECHCPNCHCWNLAEPRTKRTLLFNKILATLLLLLLPSLGWGQAVVVGPLPPQPQIIEAKRTIEATQPKELKLKIGEFEILEPSKEAKQPLQFQYLTNKCYWLWRVKAGQPFGIVSIRRGDTERRQHFFEAKPYEWAIIEAKAPGSEIVVINRNGANKEVDPPEEIDRVQVIAGGVSPTPDDPKPDDPNPVVPIPGAGLRVLFVYESKDLSKLPSAQVQMLTAKSVLDYLDAKCAKDNGVPEYRKFDQNTDISRMSDVWKQAMVRPRTTLPWLLISNGKDGYEGEWPKNTDELLKLLKRYGGE